MRELTFIGVQLPAEITWAREMEIKRRRDARIYFPEMKNYWGVGFIPS
jgi:hypothetical protein